MRGYKLPTLTMCRSRILSPLLVFTAVCFAVPCPSLVQSALAAGGLVERVTIDTSNAPYAKTMDVWTYRPSKYSSSSRVLVVIHGARRNARTYMSSWIHAAELYNVLIIAPRFTKKAWPKSRNFNLARLMDKKNRLRPISQTAFATIERIFDTIIKRYRNRQTSYYLYGHSAGGQFVHRMVMFHPTARIKAAVAANAGWYTMPTNLVDFPYGLAKTGLSGSDLRPAFARPLMIVLGQDDDDPDHGSLRRNKRVDRQGTHRLARGRTFFAQAKRQAAWLGHPFRWQLLELPEVEHNHRQTIPASAKLLFTK